MHGQQNIKKYSIVLFSNLAYWRISNVANWRTENMATQHVLSHHHCQQLMLPHYSQLLFLEVNPMPVAAYVKRDAD
jgi:hypothetical protein